MTNKNEDKGIHIEKNIYLVSDQYKMMLREYSGKLDKNGNETFVTLGYYGNIAHVARALYDIKIKKSTASTLTELVYDHKKFINEVKEAFSVDELLDIK